MSEEVPRTKSSQKGEAAANQDLVQDGANTPEAAQKTDSAEGRRSRWATSLDALRYVNSLSRDDYVKVRESDRATSILLLIGSILTVISLVFKPLAAHRLSLVLFCDVLVFFTLLFYVANRFGIVRTLTPRQALLTWQLIMGGIFLGIFITINLAVTIALVVVNSSMQIPR
jgi:hypothetical protein